MGIEELWKAENRGHNHAMELLRIILTDLPHDGFTEEDVRDSFNPLVKEVGDNNYESARVRFGRSDLHYLVGIGALEYDEFTKTYAVNCINPALAREMLDEEDLYHLRKHSEDYWDTHEAWGGEIVFDEEAL